jgi:hypothetical protein
VRIKQKGQEGVLLRKENEAGTGTAWALVVTAEGLLEARFGPERRTDGGRSWRTSVARIDDGRWHQLIASGAGQVPSLFIDGAADRPGQTHEFTEVSTRTLVLGTDRREEPPTFDFEVARVRIFDQSLGADAALTLCNETVSRFSGAVCGATASGIALGGFDGKAKTCQPFFVSTVARGYQPSQRATCWSSSRRASSTAQVPVA